MTVWSCGRLWRWWVQHGWGKYGQHCHWPPRCWWAGIVQYFLDQGLLFFIIPFLPVYVGEEQLRLKHQPLPLEWPCHGQRQSPQKERNIQWQWAQAWCCKYGSIAYMCMCLWLSQILMISIFSDQTGYRWRVVCGGFCQEWTGALPWHQEVQQPLPQCLQEDQWVSVGFLLFCYWV